MLAVARSQTVRRLIGTGTAANAVLLLTVVMIVATLMGGSVAASLIPFTLAV